MRLSGFSGSTSATRAVLRGAIIATAAVHALPILGTATPLRRAVLPLLSGRGEPGGTALTFDDGPDPYGTPAVLRQLDRLGWQATFFMLGSQVVRYPKIAAAVAGAGHEIAVHGFEHRNHLTRNPVHVMRDLPRARTVIEDATGTSPRWCRPPYGVLSAATLVAAYRTDLMPVLWTAWGKDWTGADEFAITRTVTRSLRDGGTILLHDSDCTSRAGSWRNTAASLPLLAAHLERRKLVVRTMSDHMSSRPAAPKIRSRV